MPCSPVETAGSGDVVVGTRNKSIGAESELLAALRLLLFHSHFRWGKESPYCSSVHAQKHEADPTSSTLRQPLLPQHASVSGLSHQPSSPYPSVPIDLYIFLFPLYGFDEFPSRLFPPSSSEAEVEFSSSPSAESSGCSKLSRLSRFLALVSRGDLPKVEY